MIGKISKEWAAQKASRRQKEEDRKAKELVKQMLSGDRLRALLNVRVDDVKEKTVGTVISIRSHCPFCSWSLLIDVESGDQVKAREALNNGLISHLDTTHKKD